MIDSLEYRRVLGHFPSSVTVITGMSDGEPIGLAIGSFTSVSLDPPLVGFLPMTSSERWSRIRQTGAFCVNMLSDEQGDLCWRFAKSSIEHPFDGVRWHPSSVTGSPVLPDSIAHIDCVIDGEVPAGDHYFVTGRVVALEPAAASVDQFPLVFFKGELGRLQRPSST